MGEYFELTFFLDKEKSQKGQTKKQALEALNIAEGKNQVSAHAYPLFAGREVRFDVYEYDDADFDFIEYNVCLADFVFTKKNFEEKINQLLQVADACFHQIDAVLFATGVYELTSYYLFGINKVESIEDFSNGVFKKFPLLFFRQGDEHGFQPTYTFGNVSCVINKDAQDIFDTPIGELMEDEGLSFEEALEKDKAEQPRQSFSMWLRRCWRWYCVYGVRGLIKMRSHSSKSKK